MRARTLALLTTLAVLAGLAAAPVAGAAAIPETSDGPAIHLAGPDQPTWAPAASATIRPGVRISNASGSCTSNFIFYERHEDEDGNVWFDIYIGLAAHCFTLGTSTQTNACTTPTRGVGTSATVGGATYPGTLAYSSWITTKDVKETDSNVCAVNDFAMVRLDPRDHGKVNPSLQYFGGPTGTRTTGTSTGNVVYSYGNSSLRQGIAALSPKRGSSIGTSNGGWNHRVYTVTPGVPGDSGSAFVDDQGRAMGVVVTLQAAPYAGSNGVTDLNRALNYANTKVPGAAYKLALGTEPFTDRIVP